MTRDPRDAEVLIVCSCSGSQDKGRMLKGNIEADGTSVFLWYGHSLTGRQYDKVYIDLACSKEVAGWARTRTAPGAPVEFF